MNRKKFSNPQTKEFSDLVKEWALLRNLRVDILHKNLKEKFKYKSFCFLWKRKPLIKKYVVAQIEREKRNQSFSEEHDTCTSQDKTINKLD